MNDAKEHIHKWGNNITWTVGFLPQWVQMRISWPAYCPLHFCLLNCFLISLSSLQSAVMTCPRTSTYRNNSLTYPSVLHVSLLTFILKHYRIIINNILFTVFKSLPYIVNNSLIQVFLPYYLCHIHLLYHKQCINIY